MRVWDSKLEERLAARLQQRGIFAVAGFAVPGSQYRADFFLPSPPFGIVEVKGALANQEGLLRAIELMDAQLRTLRPRLGSATRGYVALVGHGPVTPPPMPDGVVLCSSDVGDADAVGDLIANDFLVHGVRLSGTGTRHAVVAAWANDAGDLTSTLSKLAMNLDSLLGDADRQTLEHEVDQLRTEIGHGHFTAAALRVGRSLEFIIYAACRSWNVPVREPLLVGLATLDAKYRELRNALLTYTAIEDGGEPKKRAKQRYLDKTGELHSVLTRIVGDIDEQVAVRSGAEPVPINPRALMSDIKARHSRLAEVRLAVEAATGPLDRSLKRRNSAAHASLDGGTREVTRDELADMVDALSEVMLCLSRCGTAILANGGSDT